MDEYRSSHRQGFVRCAIDLHSPTELGTKFRPPPEGPDLDVLDRFPEFSVVGGDEALVASLWSSNSLRGASFWIKQGRLKLEMMVADQKSLG